MEEDNYYFELARGMQGELTDEVLVGRMTEINLVLGELGSSRAWQILLRDSRDMIKQLDDHWQDMMPDSPQFKEARVIKMASKHISDLPEKYLKELKTIEEELTKRQSPHIHIQKDNDNE